MTEEELEEWQEDFDAFHARFADLFERSESREQAKKYLRGLLTEAQRKNSWQVAEAVVCRNSIRILSHKTSCISIVERQNGRISGTI
jgi:SRSO17 transposase